jgi:hypothetical protein
VRRRVKECFCEELEQVFNHFCKYHVKILLGDFNANVWRENIFKPTIEKESQVLNKYSGDQIEKNEMSRACCGYGGEERCIQGFRGET